jgi:hypothetical protein
VSLKDLDDMGLLRPKAQWDGQPLPSGVPLWALGVTAALEVTACVAIALGDGGWITWIGVTAYLAGLFGFVGANIVGVGRHRLRRRPPADTAESPPGSAPPTTR